jgi:hypothetical protein
MQGGGPCSLEHLILLVPDVSECTFEPSTPFPGERPQSHIGDMLSARIY